MSPAALVVLPYRGKRLALVEPWREGMAGHPHRALPAWEADPVVAYALGPGGFETPMRSVYARLTRDQLHTPPRLELIGWFSRELRHRRLAVIDLDQTGPAASDAPADPAQQRLREVDALLAQANHSELQHQGNSYRVARAGVVSGQRGGFEVLSEREARALLQAMADDPRRPADQQKPLEQLLALSARNEPAFPSSSLLLLRRIRQHFRPEEVSRPITPSQLRSQLHFIQIEAVDVNEQPVAGVALELLLADGTTQTLTTDDDGLARAAPVPVGNTTIRVTDRDGSTWSAVGGAPAKRSAKQGPAQMHEVQQGQCLSRIAASYGFRDWRVVWQFDQNAALRKKRKNPNVLYPGDQLAIPGTMLNEIERATDASHRIQMKTAEPTVDLSVSLSDDEGKALSGPYELRWGSGPEPKLSGTLDGSGAFKEKVPLHVQEIELRLPERGECYLLSTSHLDPTEDETGQFVPSGVASRLCGLGYLYAVPDQPGAADLRDALIDFQREEMGQSDPTGEIDHATCSKLEELYGA